MKMIHFKITNNNNKKNGKQQNKSKKYEQTQKFPSGLRLLYSLRKNSKLNPKNTN